MQYPVFWEKVVGPQLEWRCAWVEMQLQEQGTGVLVLLTCLDSQDPPGVLGSGSSSEQRDALMETRIRGRAVASIKRGTEPIPGTVTTSLTREHLIPC